MGSCPKIGDWMKNLKDPCFYCKRDMRKHGKTDDHVIPLSKGGKNKGNIVRCCKVCNQFKSNKDLQEWLDEIRVLVGENTGYKLLTVGDLGNIISGIKQLMQPKVKQKKSRVKERLVEVFHKVWQNPGSL